jgi:hypothetical protein
MSPRMPPVKEVGEGDVGVPAHFEEESAHEIRLSRESQLREREWTRRKSCLREAWWTASQTFASQGWNASRKVGMPRSLAAARTWFRWTLRWPPSVL